MKKCRNITWSENYYKVIQSFMSWEDLQWNKTRNNYQNNNHSLQYTDSQSSRSAKLRSPEFTRMSVSLTSLTPELYSRPRKKCSMYVCIFGFKGSSTSNVIGARSEMMMDDYDGQMIFGNLVGLKLPDIRLTGEEKPRKTSPRKLVPTGDRTRARCVTSPHATTCSTAVDEKV